MFYLNQALRIILSTNIKCFEIFFTIQDINNILTGTNTNIFIQKSHKIDKSIIKMFDNDINKLCLKYAFYYERIFLLEKINIYNFFYRSIMEDNLDRFKNLLSYIEKNYQVKPRYLLTRLNTHDEYKYFVSWFDNIFKKCDDLNVDLQDLTTHNCHFIMILSYMFGSLKIIKYVINTYHLDPYEADVDGGYAIILCCKYNHIKIFRYLRSVYEVMIYIIELHNYQALKLCCYNNNYEMLKCLFFVCNAKDKCFESVNNHFLRTLCKLCDDDVSAIC